MRRRIKQHPLRRNVGFASPKVRSQHSFFSADQYEILNPGKRLTPDIEIEKPDELLSKFEDHEIVSIVRDQFRNDSNIKSWIKNR